jgi:hypothetical protein
MLGKPVPIRAELIFIADLAVNVYKPKTYAFLSETLVWIAKTGA